MGHRHPDKAIVADTSSPRSRSRTSRYFDRTDASVTELPLETFVADLKLL